MATTKFIQSYITLAYEFLVTAAEILNSTFLEIEVPEGVTCNFDELKEKIKSLSLNLHNLAQNIDNHESSIVSANTQNAALAGTDALGSSIEHIIKGLAVLPMAFYYGDGGYPELYRSSHIEQGKKVMEDVKKMAGTTWVSNFIVQYTSDNALDDWLYGGKNYNLTKDIVESGTKIGVKALNPYAGIIYAGLTDAGTRVESVSIETDSTWEDLFSEEMKSYLITGATLAGAISLSKLEKGSPKGYGPSVDDKKKYIAKNIIFANVGASSIDASVSIFKDLVNEEENITIIYNATKAWLSADLSKFVKDITDGDKMIAKAATTSFSTVSDGLFDLMTEEETEVEEENN